MIRKIARYQVKAEFEQEIIAVIEAFVAAIGLHEPETFYAAYRQGEGGWFLHFVSLEVTDIQSSTAWHEEALGFRPVFEASSGMVHLRRERYQDLLLFPSSTGYPVDPGEGLTINFLTGVVSLDALAERVRDAGSGRVEGPLERPWNVRELTVYDPDGYRLRFSEPVDVEKPFEGVVVRFEGEDKA